MSLDALSVGELNVLPHGWLWASLGQLGSWIGGGTPSKSVAAYWANGSIPWVSPKDMKTQIIQDTEDHITEAAVANSATKFVPAGSVLMVMRSGILRHTFPVAVNADRVTVNQDLRALIPAEGINPRYVAHYLRGIQRQVLDKCSKDGTTVQSIEVSALERVHVPIAPTAEQRRIVARIGELFAEIAEGEAALNGARQGLDTWRRALLKAAVTGELTRDWREANRPAETGADLLERILHRRRADWEKRQAYKRSEMGRLTARYPAPDAPSAPASWELPKTWAWASLDQITRGDRPSSYGVLQPGVDVPGGIPLVRVGDIHDGRVEVRSLKRIASAIAAEYSRTQLSGGELLITLVGAIGRTAVVPPELSGANTARAVGVIPLSGPVNAAWVELWFRSPSKQIEMVGKAHEVARKTLNLEDVRAAGIAIPPRAEQDEIVARVEALVGASELEGALSNRDAQALRQAILKAAFEGRLVPQDSTDEPASALLARLRNGHQGKEGRRRRARVSADFSYPSLPGLNQSVKPRV